MKPVTTGCDIHYYPIYLKYSESFKAIAPSSSESWFNMNCTIMYTANTRKQCNKKFKNVINEIT